MNESTKMGPHEVRFEADTGFIFVIQDGVLDAGEATLLSKAVKTYGDRSPGEPVFVLADGRKSTGVSREARQVVATGESSLDEAFVALFGTPLAIRVIST